MVLKNYSYDLLTWARTVWGEARGESRLGQIAVAFVILNRARYAQKWFTAQHRAHPLFGNGSISAACQAPYQFSCWNADDPNRPKMHELSAATLVPLFELVNNVLGLKVKDPTLGATHYHSVDITPIWVAKMKFLIQIGHHRFYTASKI